MLSRELGWQLHLGLGLQEAQGHCAHWVSTLNLQPCGQQHLVHLQDQDLQVTRECRGLDEKRAALLPGPLPPRASPNTGPLGDWQF